jgi:ribosomal protein L7/L12
MTDPNPLPGQVVAALMRGDRIQAVRLLREVGGQGLKETLAAVEAWSAQQTGEGQKADLHAIRAALHKGKVIDTIRQLREANPAMDLRPAKAAVDATRHGAAAQTAADAVRQRSVSATATRPPTVTEGDRGGYAVVLLVLAAAIASLVWWFASA